MKVDLRGGALQDDSATLDDLREAVTTLEDTTRIARASSVARAPGGGGTASEIRLRESRAALAARETPRGVSLFRRGEH